VNHKIQEELCIEFFQKKMAEHPTFVESLSTKRAFQTISISKFASCLLQIQVALSTPIQKHRIHLKIQEACQSFESLILQSEVTMGSIDNVSSTGNKLKSILMSLGCFAASRALDNAFKELGLYKKMLQACDILASLCKYLSGKGYLIQGIQEWSIDLAVRKETWMSTPLRVSTGLTK